MDDPDAGRSAPGVGSRAVGEGSAPRPSRVPSAPGPARNGASATPAPRKRRKRRRKAFHRDRLAPAPQNAAPERVDPRPAEQPSKGADLTLLERPAPALVAPSLPAPASRRASLPVFAALDLGTNNCRLLVAVPAPHRQFRVIDAFSRIVRLGEGLSATGVLSDAAMTRAVEALKVCADKLRARDVQGLRLIATEATRAAANGEAFLSRVKAETGLVLEIIDRHTEAQLAVSGCGSLVDNQARGVTLFDIGGGSTEIALVDLSARRPPRLADAITAWTSLPVGVVSLAETFGGRTVTRDTFAAMVAHVAGLLTRFPERNRLASMVAGPRFHLLGTSGTVTTLAGIHLKLERYDRRRVDGLWLDTETLDRIVADLVGWDFATRVANPCIGPDRADLVLAGCAILEAIRAVWPAKRLRVADRGLREGILSELMAQADAWSALRPERKP